MTTFDKLWQALQAKRPLLKDESATVEIVVANFKALLRQVWDKARESQQTADAKFKDLISKLRG